MSQMFPATKIESPGAFADIFIIEDKIYKVFIGHKHHRCGSPERKSLEDELRRITFKSEYDAWEIAAKSEELKSIIPIYYGKCVITRINDENGSDVSDRYLLECCLSMEKINGKDIKFDLLKSEYPEIIAKFQKAGIKYTLDMSAFPPDGNRAISLIDFPVSNAYTDTE